METRMTTDTRPRLRPCTRVYLLLLALTTVTLAVGHLGAGGPLASSTVLGIALLKGHLIGDDFMALKGVRGPWRWVILVWLTLVGGLVATAFLLAGSPPP
jgi:cytochrome c oxidase subunit IV